MPSLTTSQKLAIAVSVPLVAVAFYMFLKWFGEDEEKEEENGVKEFFSSSDVVLEMRIPQRHIGAVIGRAGCVIKHIQKETKTRINLKDEESGDELNEAENERTVVIRGSRETSKQAELLIRKIIIEQPVMEEETMEIPQQAIGRIIGKKGTTIRQLCRMSGAKITIARGKEQCSSQTCEIVGSVSAIKYAKQLIEEKINEDKLFEAKHRHGKDYTPVKSKSTFVHLPTDGEYFGVYVSATETPGHFWIQKVTKDAKELDKLIEEMTVFYGDQGGGQTLSSLQLQHLCCAPFQHDQSWYRCEIIKIISANEVCVFYLDFGDTGTVSTLKVKQLREEFSQLPFQAIECCLANIQAKDKKWSKVACGFFDKICFCTQWKVLMARIVCYRNGIPCIELFNTNHHKDINIEEELVKEDHAVYNKKWIEDEVKDNLRIVEKPSECQDEAMIVENGIALYEMNEQSPSDTPTLQSDVPHSCTQVDSLQDVLDTDVKARELASEPRLSAVEENVVACVDLSKLATLLEPENLANLPQVGQNGGISADDVRGSVDESWTEQSRTLSLEENDFDEVEHVGNVEGNATEAFLQSEPRNGVVENALAASSTDIDRSQVQDDLKNELHFSEYGGHRRYSDEALTSTAPNDHHGNSALTRSSSEIVVSPRRSEQEEKVDGKEELCSKSLGSLSHLPKGSKRLLAANFNQLLRRSKRESDDDDDGDDDDSLYLSARDESDSAGFMSATDSNSNIQEKDTDSDVTPSGYLSDADDESSDSLEGTTLQDQVTLDTTLVSEKLKEFRHK